MKAISVFFILSLISKKLSNISFWGSPLFMIPFSRKCSKQSWRFFRFSLFSTPAFNLCALHHPWFLLFSSGHRVKGRTTGNDNIRRHFQSQNTSEPSYLCWFPDYLKLFQVGAWAPSSIWPCTCWKSCTAGGV